MNNKKPYGFIYTTYTPDGYYYKGQHKIINHDTLDPNYFGSGVILSDYIDSKGDSNLIRVIEEFAMSGDELNILESIHITDADLKNPLCMNIDTGGKHLYNSRSNDVRSRIGSSISKLRKENPQNWPVRRGIHNNKSKRWKLVSPDGIEYFSDGNFKGLCDQVGISASTMALAVRQGWIPTRGVCANWKCYNLTDNTGTVRETANRGVLRSGINNPSHKAKLKRQQLTRNNGDEINE